MSAIFGGSKQSQKSDSYSDSKSYNKGGSWNDAYGDIKEKFGGYGDSGAQANKFLSHLLGLGGAPEAEAAYGQYKDSAGYGHIMDSGVKAIDSSMAAKGMGKSGAAMKELSTFGQNTGAKFYNDYLDKLLGFGNQGIAAGGLMAQAGQRSYNEGESVSTSKSTSTGSGSSKPGIGQFIGSIASAAAASDPRLKHSVARLGELPDGLGIYSFEYIGEKGRHIGVMADEVAEIQPEALGPEIDGFMTVDYDKLKGWENV